MQTCWAENNFLATCHICISLDVQKVHVGFDRSHVSTPHVGKMFDAPPALPKATRKALGTVNRAAEKSIKTNGPLKQKQTAFSTKKVSVGYK